MPHLRNGAFFKFAAVGDQNDIPGIFHHLIHEHRFFIIVFKEQSVQGDGSDAHKQAVGLKPGNEIDGGLPDEPPF